MELVTSGGLTTVRGAYHLGSVSVPTEFEVKSVRDIPEFGSEPGDDYHVVVVKRGELYYEGTVNSDYKIQKGDNILFTPQLGSHIGNVKKI